MKSKKIKNMLMGLSCLLMMTASSSLILSVKLEETYKENTQLEHQIEDNNKKISELRDNIEELNEILKEKDNEIESKNNEILEKDNKINDKDNEINSLKNKLEEVSVRQLEKNIKEIPVELTGYCNCSSCSGGWGGTTALGTGTRVGVIAAPKEIALGSKIVIDELKWYKNDATFTVEDRGGAVVKKSNGAYVIDVWFPSHEQAINFGRVKTVAKIMN